MNAGTQFVLAMSTDLTFFLVALQSAVDPEIAQAGRTIWVPAPGGRFRARGVAFGGVRGPPNPISPRLGVRCVLSNWMKELPPSLPPCMRCCVNLLCVTQ